MNTNFSNFKHWILEQKQKATDEGDMDRRKELYAAGRMLAEFQKEILIAEMSDLGYEVIEKESKDEQR